KGHREGNTNLTRTPRNTYNITTPLPQLLHRIKLTPEPLSLLLLLPPLLTCLALLPPLASTIPWCHPPTNLASKSNPTTPPSPSSLQPIPTSTTPRHLKATFIFLPTPSTPSPPATNIILLLVRSRL
ncbi:uncharacterized protein CLUP02_08557, partial [Colletotrichum lupini]